MAENCVAVELNMALWHRGTVRRIEAADWDGWMAWLGLAWLDWQRSSRDWMEKIQWGFLLSRFPLFVSLASDVRECV